MRWRAAIVTLLLLPLAACTSPEVALPEPEEVETCDGLVEAGVTYVEQMVESLPGQPLEVITGEAPMPERLAALAEVGRELDVQAAKLGCDAAELNAAIAAEVADLGSEEPIVQLFLELMREGVVGTLPPAPTTIPPTTLSGS